MSAINIFLKIIPVRSSLMGSGKLSNVICRSIHEDRKSSFNLQKLTAMKDSLMNMDNLRAMQSLQNIRLNIDAQKQKEKLVNAVVKKSSDWHIWYIKKIGLDEVKKSQERVITMQDQLTNIQIERREIDKKLKDQRKVVYELQEKINKINRYQDENSRKLYMELVNNELDALTIEKKLSQTFEEVEKAEREAFTLFCNSIRDSHEKERAQAEYTKYFTYILSIIGTIVGAVVAFIINSARNKDLVSGIEKGMDKKIVNIHDQLGGLNRTMGAILDSVRREQKQERPPPVQIEPPQQQHSTKYIATVAGVAIAALTIVRAIFGF